MKRNDDFDYGATLVMISLGFIVGVLWQIGRKLDAILAAIEAAR